MALAVNEALKPDMSTFFENVKKAECVQAYKNAGTFQTTNEAIKPMQGKVWKVRG